MRFCPRAVYTRQAGDDTEIDVEEVEKLLMERNFLRRNRDFDGADEVRNQLNAMGVRVLDRELEWYVMRKRTSTRPAGAPRDFGPLGHDYTRAADDKTELDEATLAEIKAKLEAIPELNVKVESLFEGAKEVALKSEASVAKNETKLNDFHEKTRVFAEKITADLGRGQDQHLSRGDPVARRRRWLAQHVRAEYRGHGDAGGVQV